MHPDVAAVVPENGLTISVPAWSGTDYRHVFGVMEDDLELVMESCDLRLKEGRFIEPQAAEIILSEGIARALDLQIGDVISDEVDEDRYSAVATELMLVGILESTLSEGNPDVQTGFVSYEYLESHDSYQPRLSNLLIVPRPGGRASVNDFAASLIDESGATASVQLEAFEDRTKHLRQLAKILDGIYSLGDGVLAVSAALVVGMINRIAIAHRLPELGLLHAVGREKHRLIRRLVFEIVTITGIGWASGLLLSITISVLLNTTPLAATGPVIDLANPTPFLVTLPTPLAVVAWVSVSVRRVLNQLDTVAIIERGKLSMEDAGSRKQRKARSSHNPLSSWVFYLRHRRRSLALLASTGLMVLGAAFPVFISTAMLDSLWPYLLSYAGCTSIVSPASTYQAVDATVLAQIRQHPAVAHVIPVRSLSMAANVIPFEFPLPVYGVRKGDIQVLLDVYSLHVGEGEMVQPQSGQIVLTRALARNRGLGVGDVVGKSVHRLDSMPTEMTIVGVLDATAPGLAEREGAGVPRTPRWAAFVSYEFVENHEQYSDAPMHVLVVPVAGREVEMETWLEENIASLRVTVDTFGTVYRSFRHETRNTTLLLAILESSVGAVMAFALATLNNIFVSQRREEFGALHAVGYSRAALLTRTLRESIGVAGAAWMLGALCCLAFLLSVQSLVYVPKGISLNLANPTPWLFTLPIPAAVIGASAGTIAWALSRLDPVAVIERR